MAKLDDCPGTSYADVEMGCVTVTVPDGPGLGIDIPEDKIRASQLKL